MSALRKVLVVDDDPVVGKSFHRVLGNKGYVVITAQDGPEALKRLAEGEYDLVFTDIKMPGMDGIEVAERVKAKRPWIPVVIVTGYGTEDNEARAKAAGVEDFLHKPLSPEQIEGTARKALSTAPAEPAPAAAQVAALEALPITPAVLGDSGLLRAWRFVEPAAMLLVAPIVGLAYVVAAPFVAVAMLAWMGVAAIARRSGAIGRIAKGLAMMMAAPFIGLAYAIALPFIGLGALAWMGLKKAVERSDVLARGAQRTGRFIRNVALFFAAPFIGLAYALAFPFIGIYLLITGSKKEHDAK